jgi:biotin-(acetyl-CoA carboxylase) ligase
LPEILLRFAENLALWEAGQDFVVEYEALSATINREVKAIAPDGSESMGIALGIDTSGALLLNEQRTIHVGDVLHLR